MGQLAHRYDREEIKRELARRLGSMELATRVAEAGITQMGSIQREAARTVTTTLATAEAMVKSASYAGRMTPEKEAEIRRHTENYLDDMLRFTDDAGMEILNVILDG